MKEIKSIQQEVFRIFDTWSRKYHHRLIIVNIVLIGLFLLHSVGYFSPYLPISNNIIIMVGLILSAVVLEAGSRIFFAASLFFWAFVLIFKLFGIEVWAERTGIYVYQSLFLGVVMLILEQVIKFNKQKR